MLSELCVRRPVFATMLVMSLVVLGIFSFRDLGVDLFPSADPATVNVNAVAARRQPRRDVVVGDRADGAGDQRRLRHRRDLARASARARRNITVRFVLERDLNDAVNDVREKVAGAIKSVPPELLPPVITKVDPDADPVMSLMVSSDAMSLRTLTEIADKQVSRAIQTVNGVGQVTIGGGRAREIHIVVDIEKLNSYGLSIDAGARRRGRRERRDSRRRRRAGQGAAAAAHAGPHRRDRGLQQHRHRDQERHADPRVGHRLRRRQLRAADLVGVAAATSRRCCSTSAARWARTPSPSSRASAQRLQTIQRTLPQVGHADRHPRRLEVHLRVGRVARGAPALRQPVRRRSS